MQRTCGALLPFGQSQPHRTFVLDTNACSLYRASVQRSFDDLGTPLVETTFCVLDLETTGGSAQECQITEIGAVRVRGGEVLGTFQTLVNPGALIPPEVTMLTGITQAMVLPAPRIEAVIIPLLEFVGASVLVGHNIRFDLSFITAALDRVGLPRLGNPSVDTCALARRLVRDEVPNCRLDTLASRFRLDHRPSHRGLDDALATTDLLHLLLERAAAFGVLGLDDLLALPRLGAHPQVAKLRFTSSLPRTPGVYWFVDGLGEVLYVGKATNLRQRVRSYFSSDDRRKIGALLRETQAIRHQPCASTLEAAVHEVRLIHAHRPRYNRVGKRWESYAYVKLTLDEAFPRLAIARTARCDGALYVGPLTSTASARLVVDAIGTVVPLRRCSARLASGRLPCRDSPCTPAQLGVATCPCSGAIDATAYQSLVDLTVEGLRSRPHLLLGPLRDRIDALARARRYEEAADMRDRAAALSGALARQRRLDRLRRAGVVRVEFRGGGGAEVRNGVLVRTWRGADALALAITTGPDPPSPDGPLPASLADEVGCIAGWLDAEAGRLRLAHCEQGLTSSVEVLPSFRPHVDQSTAAHR
jgi:DNA polymerase-3 subunit epsilon